MPNRLSIHTLPATIIVLAMMLPGCYEEETIHAYTAPKDPPEAPRKAMKVRDPHAGHGHAQGQAPKLIDWKVPSGWQRASSPQRYATFVAGEGDEQLVIMVSRFPGMMGGPLANVNRWRNQVGLKPVDDERFQAMVEEGKQIRLMPLAGRTAMLTDLINNDKRMLVAMFLGPDNHSWFVKTTGTPDLVNKHMVAFIGFLSSLNFPVAFPPGGIEKFEAAAPESWQADPSVKRPVLRGYTIVDGVNVTLTVLGGDGGGWEANLNRWRRQLKLGDATQEDLKKITDDLAARKNIVEVAGGNALVFDLTSGEFAEALRKRTIVVMAPRQGEVWFLKMNGPAKLVAKKEADKGE
jgi:hypothetical protein